MAPTSEWRTQIDAAVGAGAVMDVIFQAKRFSEFKARANYYVRAMVRERGESFLNEAIKNVEFGCSYFANGSRQSKTFDGYVRRWKEEKR